MLLQYGRSDSYRVATTQDKDEKESPKKKGGKDLDDLKKEVPIVCTDHTHTHTQSMLSKPNNIDALMTFPLFILL